MTATGSGRPRDPRIDAAVLDAARDMLVEVGYDQLSLRALAARAGVSRAAMARRWESKAHLVLDAVLGLEPDLRPFEGADRAGWIRWVATGSSEVFRSPAVRAAVPALLATLRDHQELRGAVWRNFSGPSAAMLPPADDRSGGEDQLEAGALLALGAGAAMFLSLIAPEVDTPQMRAKVLEILLLAAGPESS